jgi:membrane-bound lytic murein transglycosylase B
MARRMNPQLHIPLAWCGGAAVAVAVALAALGTAASAQSESQPAGYTGSVSPGASPTTPRPWSGQSGASGHPQMTAEAIRAAAANFPNCLAGLWPLAARRGISRPTFESATAGLEPDLRIMDLLDAQPEFTKAVWDYLDILVTDARIARGQEILATHRGIFDAMETTHGVDRHVVAAIWGIESNYGTAIGERSVVRSTATLACVGRRQAYFRDELLATLEILERGDVSPEHLKGSWAGAFGPTQFMPTSFKRHAVDFDGDGRRDVVDSVADVIGSTANNLRQDGWAPGETWGYEVTVPEGFDFMLADRSRLMALREWQALGLKRANGKPFPRPADRAFLLVPAGARGPGFLMLNNFRVIMKYNPAEAYALAIGHFADRLRGDPPLVQAWPRDERVLSVDERYELQERLNGRGFAAGDADGRFGPRTRAAIREFQARAGMVPDGFPSAELLRRLRGP